MECGKSLEEKVADTGYCASTEGGSAIESGGGVVGGEEGVSARASGPRGTASVQKRELEIPGGLAAGGQQAGELQAGVWQEMSWGAHFQKVLELETSSRSNKPTIVN